MEDYIIRNETENDFRAVEELTRDAFWNVYKPGRTLLCAYDEETSGFYSGTGFCD